MAAGGAKKKPSNVRLGPVGDVLDAWIELVGSKGPNPFDRSKAVREFTAEKLREKIAELPDDLRRAIERKSGHKLADVLTALAA